MRLRPDRSVVALQTSAAPDGHSHVAIFNDSGDGFTTRAGGHEHQVRGCEVLEASGHTHELTTVRVELDDHDLPKVA